MDQHESGNFVDRQVIDAVAVGITEIIRAMETALNLKVREIRPVRRFAAGPVERVKVTFRKE